MVDINKVVEAADQEIFDKIVLITTDDYKRIVYFDVSSVKRVNNKIAIRKLSKKFQKVNTTFILPETIQKITVAQSLFEHEVISEESLLEDDEEDEIDDYVLNW